MSSIAKQTENKTYHSFWFVLILFGLTATLLIWNTQNRLIESDQQHIRLLENSVSGTSRAISLKIKELKRAVRLFGEREKSLLLELVKVEENFDAYEQIIENVKQVFPEAFAVTLANNEGEPYIEDFDGFISMQCLIDIKQYATTGTPIAPYLHTNPYGYHIDIMVKINLNETTPVIFFISFRPEVIVELLANNQLFEHDMMLTHFEKPNLVEITAAGSRKILDEKEMFLTEQQEKAIVYSREVKGTLWNLIYLSDDDTLTVNKQIWIETGTELILLLLFCIFMLRRLSRSATQISKARQIAEDANKSKSAFLANMSHEIRTPLTAIIGFAQTLTEKNPTEKQRTKAANTIMHNGQHLLSLINNILDLSKIEAGKLDIEKISMSPFQLVSEIELLIKPQAEEKDLIFNIDYCLPLPDKIISDPTRLKQILINLCSNAIKFTKEGKITIRISYSDECQQLNFDIIDSGVGLTKKQSETIFDEFTQADTSTTRQYGGTGLGLSLTLKLVNLLGGTIKVVSEPDVGSQFTFSIDTGASDNVRTIENVEQIPEYISPNLSQQINSLTGSVLLAEDTVIIQELFSIYINKMGPRLTIVNNGQEAVDRALSEDFDLILMDMQMPVMDGVEAVTILREKNYQAPIIALTANALKEDRQRCLAAGFNHFLTKPIQQSELYAKMAEILPSVNQDSDSDRSPIISNILDDEPELHDIVMRFIASLPDTIQEMKQAAHQQDWNKLQATLHQLVSTSGGLGYPNVVKLTREIEEKIRELEYDHVHKMLSDLTELFERIMASKKLIELKE